MTRGVMLLMLTATIAAPAALAEPAGPDGTDVLRCAAIVGDADRLACYDGIAAAMSADAARLVAERARAAEQAQAQAAAAAAQASRDAEAAAAKARETAAVESFGANALPETRKPASVQDAPRLDQLDAVIVEMFSDSSGRLVFVLDNDQMWRQIDGGNLPTLRAGDAVAIKRGAFGSYRMTLVQQRRTISVRRER